MKKIYLSVIKKFTEKSYIAVFTVVLIGSVLQLMLLPSLNIKTDRLAYLHYNIIKLEVTGNKNIVKNSSVEAVIYKDGEKISTVGGADRVEFIYSEEEQNLKRIFPVPRRAENGFYNVKLVKDGEKIIWEDVFYVTNRVPQINLEEPLKVFNLESTRNIHRFEVETPEGEKKGYKGIFDWINYVGGNTLWYLAAQTSSYSEGDIDRDLPWLKDNLTNLNEFARASGEAKIGFGAWITCYRIFGRRNLKPDWYNYSYKYYRSSGEVKETEGISLLDSRRYNDIKKMARRFNENPDIDYIGLDYIRPAGGGLEMVDEFVVAMEIEVPDNWDNLEKENRMAWLGDIVTRSVNRNDPIIEKWNWWRAHRVSTIISRLRRDIDFKKPLWTFTLSWELGHEHGQDPIMFQDAGADLVGVMMYETDGPRFDFLISRWKEYTRDHPVNLVMGNQIDWPLHQYSVYPSGPAEYNRRLEKGIKSIKEGRYQNLKGVFINDFSRALWGRKGPYSKMEWVLASARSFTKVRDDKNINIDIIVPPIVEHNKEYSGQLKITNLQNKNLDDIKLNFMPTPGINLSKENYNVNVLKGKDPGVIDFDFKVEGIPDYRLGRYMLGVRGVYNKKVYIDFKNLWVKNVPPDILRDHR